MILLWVTFSFIACSPKILRVPENSKPQIATAPKQDTLKPAMVLIAPDTLKWKDVSDLNPPVKVTESERKIKPEAEEKSKMTTFKNQYLIRLFIPLNSDQYSSANLAGNRFVQFYAGMLVALEELESGGAKLLVEVVDTEFGTFKPENAFETKNDQKIDLIIGPFEREDLKYVVNEAQNRNITVISPWQTSTKITKKNPNYLQLKPNLKEHFNKIVEHVCSNFEPGQVAVVTHNNQEGISWFNYLSETSKSISGKPNFLTHVQVSKDSLTSPNTAFVNLFRNQAPSAIILPYYSFNDEDKLYSVVRRISADKGNKKVIIYGMPLLIDSEKIDYEFYSTLQTRIAISDFVNEDNYRVKQFKRRYFELFGELAHQDALKGYDVMMFIGRNLREHGVHFQKVITGMKQTYLQSAIELREAFAEDFTDGTTSEMDYYENKHINIIEFRNSGFEIID